MTAAILHLRLPSEPSSGSRRIAGPTRLTAARPQVLTGVQGEIWVTVDHDPRDVVLGSGQRITVPADRTVTITSVRPGASFEALLVPVPLPTPASAPQPKRTAKIGGRWLKALSQWAPPSWLAQRWPVVLPISSVRPSSATARPCR